MCVCVCVYVCVFVCKLGGGGYGGKLWSSKKRSDMYESTEVAVVDFFETNGEYILLKEL